MNLEKAIKQLIEEMTEEEYIDCLKENDSSIEEEENNDD